MRGYPIALETPPPRPVPAGLPLCCALEQIAGDTRLGRATLLGMPWFSPILGSGCLDLGDGPDLRPAALRGLRKTIDEVESDADRAAGLQDAVESFVESLIDARAPGVRATAANGHGGTANDGGSAATRLVIVAALLTRAFHQGSLQVGRPIGQRFLTSIVPLPRAALEVPEADLRVTVRKLVQQMKQPNLLRELAAYWKDETFWDDLAVHLLAGLDRTAPDGGGPQGAVSGFDVQFLTELAWLSIVKDSALYPGWSDLLVGLMGTPPGADHVRGIRQTPKQLDAKMATQVGQLLDPVTNKSWQSRQSSGDNDADGTENSDRRTFYSQIAHLLNYQAEFRAILHPSRLDPDEESDDYYLASRKAEESVREATRTRTRLTNEARSRQQNWDRPITQETEWPVPRPLSLVTSFDIELEMAFWFHQIPFVVVLPVLASPTSSSQHGRVVWLAAKFDPSTDKASDRDVEDFRDAARQDDPEVNIDDLGALERLVNLRKGRRRWVPAPEVMYKGPADDWSNLPTVVRLSGSPLIQVDEDDVDPLVRSYGGISANDHFELIHALTIDEYSSMRLSAHEIYALAVPGRTLSDLPVDKLDNETPSTGLPPSMLAGTDPMPRVWVSFGVQVDDPAIRMRLFSQLSVASIAPTLTDAALRGGDASATREGGDAVDTGASGAPNPVRAVGGDPGRAAAGLAINRRFNDADAAVMRWLGFEFAQVGVHTLVEDVRHYTEHLRLVRDQLSSDDLRSWPDDRVSSFAAPESRRVVWGRARDSSCPLLNEAKRR